jgi:hypothetical protein
MTTSAGVVRDQKKRLSAAPEGEVLLPADLDGASFSVGLPVSSSGMRLGPYFNKLQSMCRAKFFNH